MNNWISKKIVFPVVLYFYGETSLDKLQDFDKTQWLTHEEIKELQFKKVKNIFCYAYEKIPYYRKVFQEYGVNPKDIQTFEDIENYPVLTKKDVRENREDLTIRPKPNKFEHRHTSGTTGQALAFIKDRLATSYMRSIDYRSYGWHGIEPGVKQARFWSCKSSLLGILIENIKDYVINRKRYQVFNLSDNQFVKYYKQMRRFKPFYIYGYTSGVYEFARFIQKNKLPPIESIKTVIATAEMLFPYQRACIEGAFKCKCVIEYGCTETGVIAFECPERNLHLMEDNLFIEFTKGGKRVQPKEPGDILLTELHNFSMPFLRLDLGDMGSYSTESCPCGRGLGLMHSIEGRQNSFFRTPDGRLIYDSIFDFMAENKHVKIFKIILRSNVKLTIKIVPQSEIFPDSVKTEFTKKIRHYIGDSMDIEYIIVDAIERDSSGKRHYFQSLI